MLIRLNKSKAGYLDVFHVCIVELFSEMLIFLKKIDDFPEIAVVVESSVLENVTNQRSLEKIYMNIIHITHQVTFLFVYYF